MVLAAFADYDEEGALAMQLSPYFAVPAVPHNAYMGCF